MAWRVVKLFSQLKKLFVRKKPKEVYPFDGRTPLEIAREFFTNLGEKDTAFTLLKRDERGEEYKVQTTKQEWRVYYTVKNDIRGGVQHKTAHNCKVIAGRVFWHVLKVCASCPAGRVEDRKICRAGELVRTPLSRCSKGTSAAKSTRFKQPSRSGASTTPSRTIFAAESNTKPRTTAR